MRNRQYRGSHATNNFVESELSRKHFVYTPLFERAVYRFVEIYMVDVGMARRFPALFFTVPNRNARFNYLSFDTTTAYSSVRFYVLLTV